MKGIRLLVAAGLAAALVAGSAPAHQDPNSDPDTGTNRRCDTWYRPNHGTGDAEDNAGYDENTGQDNPGSHHDTAGSDIGPVHSQQGHHLVRDQAGYVEVVGGQGYDGPDNQGQGGYVQGELDPGSGAPDVDFHFNFFGPDIDRLPAADPTAIQNWALAQDAFVCVNAANSRVCQSDPWNNTRRCGI